MKLNLILVVLCSVLLSLSCKKKSGADPQPQADSENKLKANFLANLESGSASWESAQAKVFFYDASNSEIARSGSYLGNNVFWKFGHLGKIDDFDNLVINNYIKPPYLTLIESIGWALKYTDGVFVMIQGNQKRTFSEVSSSEFTLTSKVLESGKAIVDGVTVHYAYHVDIITYQKMY